MSCASTSRTIICQEVFDENSQPSEEEVLQYAKRIGINPETESYLLSIARQGLMQALPPGWKPVYDDKLKRYYYFNFENGSSRWDHPLDDYYKAIVKKKRSDGYCSTGEEDSKTSIKEDLKSYEEPPDTTSETMHSSRSKENLRLTKRTTKRFTSPTGDKTSSSLLPLTTRPPLPPRRGRSVGGGGGSGLRSGGSTSPLGRRSPSPVERRPRGLQLGPTTRDTGQFEAMPPLEDRSPLDRPFKGQNPVAGGFKITGGGSIFLKSRQKNTNTTSSSVSPQSTATSPSFEQRRITDSKNPESFDSKEPGLGVDLEHQRLGASRFENVHDDVESLQSLIDEVASRVESQAHDVSSFPLKGILRDSSPTSRALWDVDPAHMTAEEKTALKNQELEDERKRSVRFADFEKLPLDIRFEMPDSDPDSLTPSSDGKEEAWESDGDTHDRLMATPPADAASMNNDDLKKYLNKRVNLNSNSLEDKTKIKTSWLEIKDKRDTEDNIKDEGELLNRLAQLKQRENELFLDNSAIKTGTRPLNKNLKSLDKIDNNNYTPNVKLDSWERSYTEDLVRNEKDITNSNTHSNGDNLEKTPDSDVKTALSDCPSDVDPENRNDLNLITTGNSNEDDFQMSSKNSKTITSSINDLLDDIKSFSDVQSQKDYLDLVDNQNNLKTRRIKNSKLFGEDHVLKNDNQLSKSNDIVNSSYKRHYFIDEDMMNRVDVTEEELINHVKSPRSFDHSTNSVDKGMANSMLRRPRDFGSNTDGETVKNEEDSVMGTLLKKDADITEAVRFEDEDENVNDGNGLEYLQSVRDVSGVSSISMNNRSSSRNKESTNSDIRPDKILIDRMGNDTKKDVNVTVLSSLGDTSRMESEMKKYENCIKMKLQTKLNELQKDLDEKLEAVKKEFDEKEKTEFERLEKAMNEKLDLVRQELKEQEEKRRTAMREITETSLEDYKRQLNVEKEEKIKELEDEQKKFLEKQEEISNTECKRVEEETNHRVQASVHILAKVVEEVKQREEKEIARIKSESEEKIELIKKEYEAKQEEFSEKMKRETDVLEMELEERLAQARARCQQRLEEEEERLAETARRESKERREAEWRRQQEEVVNTADEHRARMQVLREECKQEEESLRKKHADKVEVLNMQLNRTLEKDPVDITQLTRDFEKVRCEKRLLEDKYRTLKEKYIKLKNDIRLSLERKRQAKLNRKNRIEQSTTEDTDRSTSHSRTEPQLRSISPRKKYLSTDDEGGENLTPKTIKRRPNSMPRPAATNGNGTNGNGANGNGTNGNYLSVSAGEDRRESPSPSAMETQPPPPKSESENGLQNPKNVFDPSPLQDRGEGGIDTEISSTDEFSYASLPKEKLEATNNRRTLKQNWIKGKKTDENRSNPLENLKQQLEKLDELEEQFPPSAHTDTYLRYPFSGPAGTSCELEFYRHRLHLERESVKRAKLALTEQRRLLDGRHAQIKRSNLGHQLHKEEVELADMEVHLHRTKALLGEKIIRLKHLEMSLEQCAPPVPVVKASPTNTLSEASHSSGFSSSDLDSSPYVKASSLRPERYWTDASFNVLQSLENINCEIREIWGILGKQQIPELGPPPLVQYTDLQQHRADLQHPDPYHMRLQTAEIADRTRGLRDWLTKARHDSTNH